MIKKRIRYEDFNGNVREEDHYFHISKTELLDNLDLRVRLEAVQQMIGGAERELSDFETKAMIDLIRDVIDLAYGQRSEDGKRFHKSEDVLASLKESPAYDELLFTLFDTPEEASEFIVGIFPKDLMEKVRAEQAVTAAPGRPQPQDRLPKKVETKSQENVKFDGEVVEQSGGVSPEPSLEDKFASMTVEEREAELKRLHDQLMNPKPDQA